MSYKETLDKIILAKSIFSNEINFIITEKKITTEEYVTAKEKRTLTEKECMDYLCLLINYFDEKGMDCIEEFESINKKKRYNFFVKEI